MQAIDAMEAIQDYFENGFELLPLFFFFPNGKRKVLPNVEKGEKVLNEAGTALNPRWALNNYDACMDYVLKNPKVSMFGIYPSLSGFLVLDLDAHEGQENGITTFLNMCRKKNLSSKMKSFLVDFPNNFPCYVTTPSHGIHLYFKATFVPRDWKKASNQHGIDIKYNNQVTAAGSIRDDGEYIMHGALASAPEITLDVLEMFTRPPEPKKTFVSNPFARMAGTATETKAKWNTTAEGIINKARDKMPNANTNEFVAQCGEYFSRAHLENGMFPLAAAIAAVEATPEHQNRKEKSHTKICLKKIYERNGAA